MSDFDGIALALFSSRLSAVCDEMGAILRRSSFSPNIKDRLDFSCAIFDAAGQLCAQAAHIPVHLGSMAYAMEDIVGNIEWQEGDMIVVNDPYLGGTHLPDVTMIMPVFHHNKLKAFVANRAHHANIGGDTPGSMPISSSLQDEGLVIEPTVLIRGEDYNQQLWQKLCDLTEGGVGGDFIAQISANKAGKDRLLELVDHEFETNLENLNHYGENLARKVFEELPDGVYTFRDVMDDDGQGNFEIPINLSLKISQGNIKADFTGTSDQVDGNINCPLSVAAAAVYYVFRCLLPDYAPNCSGLFRPISIEAPKGCLLNASWPKAVAAGNVETSTRIVDVVLGALAEAMPDKIPAASYGSMNNIAMGSAAAGWSYYETIGGGGGAHAQSDGVNAVQCHMTNTLNTPIESLELHYPLRLRRYQIRTGSGGNGDNVGGSGIVREYELLDQATITLLTERRLSAPWGINAGEAGQKGANRLNGEVLPPKCERNLKSGDVLTIETPGGGGWSQPD